ncbi:hypothetical protein LTR84_008971 [Exophiala bonariae]|uniref:Xylanolytic transcriptional activator regulatory domain-containing protein n=1 Tax=Exophiala bonariae TaxID=1690606 RepID=A0AAV9MW00_9EURO|nr:hypothetical protein LTR84_008971 [Exophiala bonariae]
MAADLNAHHAKAATRIVDTRDYDQEDTTILLADIEAGPLADSGFEVGPAFESIGVSGLSADQGQDRGLSDSAVRVRRYEDPHHSTEAFIGSLGSHASEPAGYFGDSSAFKFVSELHVEQGHESTTSRNRSTATNQDGLNKAVQVVSSAPADFHNSLPSRDHANELVDAYFERVHLIYPFIHEPTFRDQYECMWDPRQSCGLAWLALANMVFAYGCEFITSKQELIDRSLLASAFVDRAKSILLAHVFKDVNLELAQGLLLLCHYLQGALELHECWNFFGLAVRSTVAIGLHVDPLDRDGSAPIETESRRRLWWGCFVLDRTLSMKFGRPPSIILHNALEVGFPLEIDDQYIVDSGRIPRQPGGKPSRTCLFVQTIKLSFVIDNILNELYLRHDKSRRGPEELTITNNDHAILGSIILLDGQLQTWWDKMPGHLRVVPEIPDGIDAQRQRNIIYLRYLQMRLLLQRPSLMLLAQPGFQDPYLRSVAMASAKRCISLANETIRLVSSQYHQQFLNSVWYLLHYVFSSLGVLFTAQSLGLSTLSDVAPPDSSAVTIGMAFLRSVSEYSVLARRYVTLLEKYQRAPGETVCTQPSNQVSSDVSISSPNDSPTPFQQQSVTILPHVVMPQVGMASRLEAELTFPNIHFPNSNEFLFGTGLPQEFLSTDWSLFDTGEINVVG